MSAGSTRDKSILQPADAQPKRSPPRRYAVLLLNDDYTPMDFVVSVLTDVFLLPHTQATAVMLLIHHQGRGLCGLYQKDMAESKCRQVLMRAEAAGHPLRCVTEPA